MPTFEEFWEEYNSNLRRDGRMTFRNTVAKDTWHARDAEIAAKDRTIERVRALAQWLKLPDTDAHDAKCDEKLVEIALKIEAALEGKQ